MSESVYLTNDNALTHDVVDVVSGTDLSGATVTVTLTDSSGVEVAGETWPLALSYVGTTTTDMDGVTYVDVNSSAQTRYRYRATLVDTLSLSAQVKYMATISVNGGAGLQGTWSVPVIAKTRTDAN